MGNDADKIRAQLSEKLTTPSDRAAFALLVNITSMVFPPLGGLLGAAEQIKSARDKEEADRLLLSWMEKTSGSLQALEALLHAMSDKPDEGKLALLLSEIVGEELAVSFLAGAVANLQVMLNETTAEELRRFQVAGLLTVTPTHSQMNMGAGNRIGNYLEDAKRPYGLGLSFVLRRT